MRYFIYIFILLISGVVYANSYAKGKMTPLESEMLSRPIQLERQCKNIYIKEWRPTPGDLESTAVSSKASNIIKNACNRAVLSFPSFINSRYSYYRINSNLLKVNVSLMPYLTNKFGELPRNLNDIKYRFALRPKTFSNGKVNLIWGFFQRSENWVYVRNDVLDKNGNKNKETEKVFIHEMFHAMSWNYNIYNQHDGNKDAIEERMAQEFTEYLGLGK